MSQKIHFLDYTVDVEKRSVFQGDQLLSVTNQGYEVLMFLIKRHGQVVSRDELMAAAWKNKIVSDATLHKQIQRLRQNLAADETIIKTIHGQGFIFVPKLRLNDGEPPSSPKAQNNTSFRHLLLGGLVALLLYLFIAVLDNKHDGINLDAVATPVVLSIIPQVKESDTKPDQWLGFGGMHYLNGRFSQSVPIQIKRLSKKQTSGKDATEQAIALTRSAAVDAVLILDVTESSDRFEARIELRNDAGVINTAKFDSLAIKDLMDQIGVWVSGELEVDSEPMMDNPIFSKDRYAVENFIRGMAAQHVGDAAQAIKYFEQATAEDDRFWQAWYELAIAYRKQGLHEKSLAILQTIELAHEASPLELRVQNAKSLALWRLGRHAEALPAISQAITVAEKTSSPAINALLTNKAIIAKEMGDLTVAQEAITRSIQIIKSSETPRDSSLGSAYNTLAGINQANQDFSEARTNAQLAVQYFSKAKDKRYEVVAKSRLASILMDMGQLKNARMLIEQNLIDQVAMTDVSGQISNHIKLARIEIALGELRQLDARLVTLSDLMTGVENQFLANQVLAIQAESRLLGKDFDHVPTLLNELADKHINEGQLVTHWHLSFWYLLETDQSQTFNDLMTAASKDAVLKQHPVMLYWQGKQLADADPVQAGEILTHAHTTAKDIKAGRQLLLLILNALAVSQLEANQEEAGNTLSILGEMDAPAYPYLKTKAQASARKGDLTEAATLMLELKGLANDYWQPADQLQLESYQKQL